MLSYISQTWVTEYFDGTGLQDLPVLVDTCGEGAPEAIGKIHIRAMYWALSTMSSLGYGSAPVAVTDAEYGLAMAVQVLGACSLALVFSNIAKIMAQLEAVGIACRTRRLQPGLFGRCALGLACSPRPGAAAEGRPRQAEAKRQRHESLGQSCSFGVSPPGGRALLGAPGQHQRVWQIL